MSECRIEKLGEVCDFIGGSQPPKATFLYDLSDVDETEYVRLIQIRDYKSDKHIVYIPKSSTRKFCSADDVMIGRYGPPVFQILKGLEGAYNVALMKAVPKTEELDRDYLFRFLESPEVQNYIIKLSERAAGQTGVNKPALHDYPILVPPIPEQKRIVAILDQAFADIELARAKTEQNLLNARELFESYLQQVFSQRGEGWVELTLGQATGGVCTGPFGSLLHKSDYIENGIPLVNPAHITMTGIEPDSRKTVSKENAARLSNYVMRQGDIVIGRRGEMGRCALITEKEDGFLCGTGSFLIRASDRFHGGYLARYLRSANCKARLEKIAGGAVMPNLSNTQLSSLNLFVPPIDKQNEIIELIDLLAIESEAIVSIYQKKLEALNELKKSILQKAFSGELTKAPATKTNKGAA